MDDPIRVLLGLEARIMQGTIDHLTEVSAIKTTIIDLHKTLVGHHKELHESNKRIINIQKEHIDMLTASLNYRTSVLERLLAEHPYILQAPAASSSAAPQAATVVIPEQTGGGHNYRLRPRKNKAAKEECEKAAKKSRFT
ncbi:hypothetical protein CRE_07422 [Caenorhabditis remanei]|uniref:Uncharacterized protein n=1 Tax=Caenorhabditis remanei TaxID=31234 RepID=E3M243_CAERE|nr:hypothetical protein CRE_07422 [Caenorhabditis remanei]